MRDGQPGSNDPFRPPDIPTEVHCIHCDQEYESYLIKWVPHDDNNPMEGFWCCPTPGCDGKGFGFDIFPTDPDWRDENGEKLWEEFDDEEDEFDEYEDQEAGEEFDAGEDPEFEWTPEWEQAAYGEREEEEAEPDEPQGEEDGKKPPEEPFDEDELPW